MQLFFDIVNYGDNFSMIRITSEAIKEGLRDIYNIYLHE